MIEATKTSFIEIKTQENKNLSVFTSKLGGFPYFPSNAQYPKLNGNHAIPLAQINFAEIKDIKKSLPLFPENGILQFFIPHDDDMFGYDPSKNKSNILVVYHEHLVAPDEVLQDKSIMEFILKSDSTPIFHECSLIFNHREETLGLIDEYNVKKHYLKDGRDITDKDYMFFEEKEIHNQGSKIGGYAHFTQADPRDTSKDDDWILLLQLDSDENLMWGDMGIGNWFIKKEDLIKRDFSKVFFTWDCC